ncbi:hypothetical protein [Nostoc sp.]|uniref:hypothetical protein n=1 Tax=Nostoc sp. TaxID=1180 RepID=UPI002FF7AB8F
MGIAVPLRQMWFKYLNSAVVYAVCNFLSNLTPNPLRQVQQQWLAAQRTGFPTSVGE